MRTSIKEARTQLYRQAILDAAERVFADRGFAGTRMQEIAEKADVSVGTIYGVFGSKAELYAVTLTSRLGEVTAVATRAAQTGSSPVDRLDRGVHAYVTYLAEHPYFLRIHLNEFAWGLGPSRGSDAQISSWHAGLDLLADVLRSAMVGGEVIEGDPVLLARSLVAIQQVHLARWIEDGMSMPASQVAARLRTTFHAMFCMDRART